MQQYRITYQPSVLKSLRKLDPHTARRIVTAIEGLAENPRPHGVRMLVGGAGELRLRVGDYRVIYEAQDERVLVLVLRVGHRREVYRG